MSQLPELINAFEYKALLPDKCINYTSKQWLINCALIQEEFYYRTAKSVPDWQYYDARNLHLFRPGTPIGEDFRFSGGKACHGLTLHVDCGNFAALPELFPEDYDAYELTDYDDKAKTLMLEVVRLFAANEPKNVLRLHACFYEFLDMIVSSQKINDNFFEISSTENSVVKNSFSEEIIGFLREKYADSITIAKLAKRFHVSESCLHHRFKEETGMSPIQMLLQVRLTNAKAMLMQGMPLQYIAEQTGFYDAFHLSKAFKKFYSLSPKQYLNYYYK